jgi:hypothetical protein
MRDDLIDRMIKHSESSESPLLKLLIDQVNQSNSLEEVEESRRAGNEKDGRAEYLFEDANLNDVSALAYIQ